MNCSICHDSINQSTGKVEISCSHIFHYKCITTWYNSQKASDKPENCPCCRYEVPDIQKLPESVSTNSSISSAELELFDSRVASLNIYSAAAAERAKHKFTVMKWSLTTSQLKAYAATVISSAWRGHWVSHKYWKYQCAVSRFARVQYNIDNAKDYIKKQESLGRKHVATMVVNVSGCAMPIHPWKNMIITKIQKVYRGYICRKHLG
jgi:hypothetical protein